MSDTNSYKVMDITVTNVASKTAETANKYTCIHVTCVNMCAKPRLATTKRLACMTVYTQRHIHTYKQMTTSFLKAWLGLPIIIHRNKYGYQMLNTEDYGINLYLHIQPTQRNIHVEFDVSNTNISQVTDINAEKHVATKCRILTKYSMWICMLHKHIYLPNLRFAMIFSHYKSTVFSCAN